jgi:uncharacterized protein (DUF305 family)
MNVNRFFLFGGVILFSVAISACSGTSKLDSDSTSIASSSNDSRSSASSSSESTEALYWARQDSARMLFVEADVQFMTGMIGHHAQALVMAAMVPSHAERTDLQTLASRIINAQNDEIGFMQKWLRDRGQPVPEVEISGLELTIQGAGDHAMHMPGMLTDLQLRELDDARGEAFDKLFLQYMIQHHRGAITMVDELFSKDGAGQDEAAFKLASDIHVDQITEIERMQLMLGQYSTTNGLN